MGMANEIGLGLVSEVSEDTLYLDVSVYQFFFKGVLPNLWKGN
jgi:hypothetical protein